MFISLLFESKCIVPAMRSKAFSRGKWNSFDFNTSHHVRSHSQCTVTISCAGPVLTDTPPSVFLHNAELFTEFWELRRSPMVCDLVTSPGHDSCHGADVCTHWLRLRAAASLPWPGSGDNREKAGTSHSAQALHCILLLHKHYTTAALQSHADITPRKQATCRVVSTYRQIRQKMFEQ